MNKDKGLDLQGLSIENTLLKQQIRQLEDSLGKSEQSLHVLHLTGFPATDSPYFARIKEAQNRLKENEVIHRSLLAMVDSLDRENNSQQGAIANLEYSFDVLADQLERRKQNSEKIQQHLREIADQQSKAYAIKLEKLEGQLQQHQHDLEQTTKALATAQGQIKQTEIQLGHALNNRWDLEQELQDTQKHLNSTIEGERTLNAQLRKEAAFAQELQDTAYLLVHHTEAELERAHQHIDRLTRKHNTLAVAHDSRSLQMATLLASLDELKSSYDQNIKKTASLEEQVGDLEKANALEREGLQIAIESEKSHKKQLENELASIREAYTTTNSKAAFLEQELSKTNEDLTLLQHQYQELSKDANTYLLNYRTLETSLSQTSDHLRTNDQKFAEILSDKDHAEAKVSALSQDLNTILALYENDKLAMQQQIAEAEATTAAIQKANLALEKELSILAETQKVLASLKQENLSVKSDLESTQNQLKLQESNQEKHVASLSQMLESSSLQIQSLNTALNDLQDQLNQAHQQRNETYIEKQQVESQSAVLAQDLNSLQHHHKAERHELEKQVSKTQAAMATLEKANQTLKNEIAQLSEAKAQRAVLQQTNQTLKTKLKSAQGQLKLSESNQEHLASLSHTVEANSQQIQSLTAALDDLTEKLNQANQQLGDTAFDKHQAEAHAENLSQNIQNLQTHHEAERQKLHDQIAEAQAAILSLQKVNQDLKEELESLHHKLDFLLD